METLIQTSLAYRYFWDKVVIPKNPNVHLSNLKNFFFERREIWILVQLGTICAVECNGKLVVKLVLYIGVTHPWLPPSPPIPPF